MANITDLIGETINKIEFIKPSNPYNVLNPPDETIEVIFNTISGKQFRMWHDHYCHESVYLNDIAGDINDLVGNPIFQAEKSENSEDTLDIVDTKYTNSFTWTFYKLATVKGYVTLRWLGQSNGHYSESVDFDLVLPRN